MATALADADPPLGSIGTEPLFGLSFNDSVVEFTVFDGGCSEPENFDIQVLESFPPQLLLVRNTADYCEAFLPEGIKLEVDLESLGLTDFTRIRVANPFYNGQ